MEITGVQSNTGGSVVRCVQQHVRYTSVEPSVHIGTVREAIVHLAVGGEPFYTLPVTAGSQRAATVVISYQPCVFKQPPACGHVLSKTGGVLRRGALSAPQRQLCEGRFSFFVRGPLVHRHTYSIFQQVLSITSAPGEVLTNPAQFSRKSDQSFLFLPGHFYKTFG